VSIKRFAREVAPAVCREEIRQPKQKFNRILDFDLCDFLNTA
jgi:hypothetical protein